MNNVFKGTKGKWELKDCTILNPNRDTKKGNIWEVAQCYTGFNEQETRTQCKANALLISKAPEMLEELNDTIDDLKILKSNILDALKTNNRWDGMAEVVQNWIDRKEQLIKEATEL